MFSDAASLRKGVDGQQHFTTFAVRVANSLAQGFVVEVQAGKIPGIGIVLETKINGVGTIVDSGPQCGQATGRTDQIRQ